MFLLLLQYYKQKILIVIKYTDLTRFIFIKILNILSELYKIVKKEIV